MRRFFEGLLLLGVGLAASGCASTGTSTGSRFAIWKPDKASADEQPDSKSSGDVAHNPFLKAAAETKSADGADKSADGAKSQTAKADDQPKATGDKESEKVETAATSKDKEKGSEPGKTPPAARTGVFGPETLRLIDAELSDATPAERAYWYDQLKKVDPAVIPQILQARRLTAQIAEQQKSPEQQGQVAFDRRDNPFSNPGRVPPGGDDWPSNPASVRNAMEQQLADGTGRIDATQYRTDQLPATTPYSQWNTPAETPQSKPAFAVTRIAQGDAAPPNAAPPAGTPSRNPLSRFLPMGTGNNVAQTSANGPSGVSLLPPTGIEARDANASLEQLIALMENDVAQLPLGDSEESQNDYIKAHVQLRMLYLMADHPERALTAIPDIDPADQEFWQQTLWGLANYFDSEHIPAAKDRAGQTVAQFATATQRLREKADLEVRNLAFCREIAYFGNIVRFPRDEFRPGDSALVYAEIENFKSELTVDGQYRTLLRSTLEILSPSGELRWHKEFPAEEDLCLNQRRDYFHNYTFVIPDRLPLGPHALKLTVFDDLSGKMVSQSLNFVVR